MNATITKRTKPNAIKLASYDLNTKIFIDFREQEKAKHKPNLNYFLLSNKIDKLFDKIKEISKN